MIHKLVRAPGMHARGPRWLDGMMAAGCVLSLICVLVWLSRKRGTGLMDGGWVQRFSFGADGSRAVRYTRFLLLFF